MVDKNNNHADSPVGFHVNLELLKKQLFANYLHVHDDQGVIVMEYNGGDRCFVNARDWYIWLKKHHPDCIIETSN